MTDVAPFSIKKSDGCPQEDHGDRVIKRLGIHIFHHFLLCAIDPYVHCKYNQPLFLHFSKRLMIYSFDSHLISYFDGSKLGSVGNCWMRVR